MKHNFIIRKHHHPSLARALRKGNRREGEKARWLAWQDRVVPEFGTKVSNYLIWRTTFDPPQEDLPESSSSCYILQCLPIMLCVNCMQFHVTLKCNMYVHDLSRMCRARIQQKGLSPVADRSASCWSWTCDLGLQPWTLGFALMVLSSNQICLPFSFLSYFAALLILTASFFCFLVSFF